MMDTQIRRVNLEDLYKLFFKKDLVQLSKPIPRTPTKKAPKAESVLTPISKSIYDSTSPRSKPYILMDLINDNEQIEKISSKAEELDLDYEEKMENNGLGFFMEDYISVYGKCPVCGEFSLKKYSHSNVPVVDLVCINSSYHLENNKCFLFQVKITLGNDYFNLNKQAIVVGSKVYGGPCHATKGTDDLTYKIIAPGYICIKLNKVENEIQVYTIDHRRSFVLVPNYHNDSNDFYYEYLDSLSRFGKNIITWDATMVDLHKISIIGIPPKIRLEYFNNEIIGNPYKNLIKLIN